MSEGRQKLQLRSEYLRWKKIYKLYKPKNNFQSGFFLSVLKYFTWRKEKEPMLERPHCSNISTENLFCFIPFENLYCRGHFNENHNENGWRKYALTLGHMCEHIYNSLKLVKEGIRKGKIKVYPYQSCKLFGMKVLGLVPWICKSHPP